MSKLPPTNSNVITMAPGVYFREIDRSQYVPQLANTIAATVGVASRGRINERVLNTSYQNYTNQFGAPHEDYPASLANREYFKHGGGILWFVRVSDGSEEVATATLTLIDGSTEDIESVDEGEFYNDIVGVVSHGSQKNTSVGPTNRATTASGPDTWATMTIAGKPVVPGTIIVKTGSTKLGEDNGAGVIVGSGIYVGKLAGTVNYLTGVVSMTMTNYGSIVAALPITITANYYSTFTLQLKYKPKDADGNVITTSILESFSNITAADAYDFLLKSKYIRLADEITVMPAAGNYVLTGGSDGKDDITDVDYIGNTLGQYATGMQIFKYSDQVDINVLAVPGVSHSSAIRQAMIQLVEVERHDTLAIIDAPPNIRVQDVADWANADGSYSSYGVLDSTYGAAYYPHYTTFNEITGAEEFTPPSAAALAAFAKSDYWEAPAGPIRGKLFNVVSVATELNVNDRAFLGLNRVNPISDVQGHGIMVAGQRTATLTPSSLDRIGARMTLMRIEKVVTTIIFPLLFEPANTFTWRRAETMVQPHLNSLVKLGRIYAGKIKCDVETNTTDIVNNNMMAAVIALRLPKYAEIIVLNFLLLPYGTGDITEEIKNLGNI